ncbi:MAG: CHAT domain-containing protein [Anaerolineae bacterium]|nr:CHAT domain-containing protein [Anaerolineae bacterium]
MTQEIVLQLSRQDGRLQAALLVAGEQPLAVQPLALDLAQLAAQSQAKEYGRLLAAAVLGGEIGAALQRAGPARLRLVVADSAAALHDLRWECLLRSAAGPAVPLTAGPATPFSRLLHPESTARAHAPQTDWPLRVVAAISNPTGLDRFDADLEWAELQRALQPLRGLVDAERIPSPVTLDRIAQALEGGPHVLHFVGHGAFRPAAGGAVIYLEEADGTAQAVAQEEWTQRLGTLSRPPHLVVLAACESAARVKEGALVGMAPALIAGGAGGVVAMRDKVGIETAREFVYHFYRRLATHGEIDRAANEARSYLLDRGESWSIPILFLERGAERIFATPPAVLEDQPARPGEVLILIPEFQGHEAAFFEIDLRDDLQQRVQEASLADVRVVWLKESAFGPGDDDDVRRLAARYGAALVIWGWYDRSRFRACFSVTEPLFAYRDPTAAPTDASVRGRLAAADDFVLFVNNDLPQQVDYFAFFTLGQLYYWEQKYDRALAALSAAIAAVERDGDNDPPGLAQAYFYRANLHAVHRQDRPAAIADYRRALALDPGLVAAAFNLGQALRVWAVARRAQGDEAGARDSLQQALQAYSQAVDARPDYAAAYGERGLAHYLRGEFELASADYQAELARAPRAETYHQLGLALRDLGRFDQALAALDRAIARAPAEARYYFGRGRLLARQGKEERASVDFQTYLRLAPPSDADRIARVRDWLTARQGEEESRGEKNARE